jgi:hypothetical protein
VHRQAIGRARLRRSATPVRLMPPASAYDPILLQKSPTSSWPKIMGNYQIGTNASLDRYCALAFDLESMLLALALEIVFQHYRPQSGHRHP